VQRRYRWPVDLGFCREGRMSYEEYGDTHTHTHEVLKKKDTKWVKSKNGEMKPYSAKGKKESDR